MINFIHHEMVDKNLTKPNILDTMFQCFYPVHSTKLNYTHLTAVFQDNQGKPVTVSILDFIGAKE